jgi:FkbM family methyltransferase
VDRHQRIDAWTTDEADSYTRWLILAMRTAHKIALARLAQRAVTLPRRLLGRGLEVSARRGGYQWELDLAEGIDFSIWLLGSFEPRTIALYKQVVRPGSVVLDIGANVGSHTVPLAGLVGADGVVHAFEATEWAFGKLRRNVAANSSIAGRVVANHCFLTDGRDDHESPEAIYSSWPLEAGGDLHPEHRGRLKVLGAALRTSLDRYAADRRLDTVSLVKIDVDGNELSVLQGGRQLLQRTTPAIVLELSPYTATEAGSSFGALLGFLSELGYRHADLIGRHRMALDDIAGIERVIGPGASLNAVLTP